MVPVSFAPFDLAGEEFALTRSGALYWPRERALLVADLHLEKGSWYAQHGALLPPYDSRETLERLADAVKATGARRVITLGDNFHDDAGTARLDPYAAGMLGSLTRALDWIWITGNHDAGQQASFGAQLAEELEVSGIVLRHEAKPGETRAELSGHFHPKLRVKLRERHIARPCGVVSRSGAVERMILPAFGAYTGGMDAGAPEILAALGPAREVDAVVATKERVVRFPLFRAAA
ncbi:ligase-associated DNA damage response endonuclease PdeM [Erythrobacter sp. HL-111]|uniref:ligase-associated DNA damage response endonuclease PdeM n=1 Tax=Erythrobacter sp. HL-111 TaxID=1798193 RepID=UPI0006D9656A|nr:ligase-associated DNA damage response endonuclease PdeM [Erythrobacter sp. HL-111]KPP92214.1 MAG: putative phosphoesterase [Erythrobacteraceae bacterium HL-111]SDS40215.1 putative phosphoesterase [Erythrobacter sp. HL-111]